MNGSVFPFNVACLVIGVRPLIRHALRRATFPVGEGDLRRGLPPGGGAFIGVRLSLLGVPSTPVPASPVHPLQAGEGKPPCTVWHRGADLSSRNPGSFLPGWGGAASGWPCFRSGGSALLSRRRSGPPLPGCGSGRRTYRSASAAHRLPAR